MLFLGDFVLLQVRTDDDRGDNGEYQGKANGRVQLVADPERFAETVGHHDIESADMFPRIEAAGFARLWRD